MGSPTLPPNPTPFVAPRLYNARQAIDLTMLCLVLGREAGNQPLAGIEAVACSIRNRVTAGLRRWGQGWEGVIGARWQYSSVNGPGADPNLLKYPNLAFAPWATCLDVAERTISGELADPTRGSHSYFDKSLDENPPTWATDGEFIHTIDIADFHFFRLATI